MASRILFNSAVQIDQTISGGYIALVLRGTGLVRNTGIQDISGAKYFYDTIAFVSGLNVSGDFVPSGYTAGHLSPKTDNLYNLGESSREWKDLWVDGIGRIDNLHVDENASITGNLNVVGTTYLSGDFIPANIATSLIPKTDNLYDLGSVSQEFRNLWIDGTGRIDSLYVDESASITGNLGVSGATTVKQFSSSNVSTTGLVSSTDSGVFRALFVTGTGIPATPTSAGSLGQIVIGSGYLYACTGTNLWGRTHLSGWV